MVESKQHKNLKEKWVSKLENQGFSTEKEKRLDNGLVVDVFGYTHSESVIVEVGSLNGDDRKKKLDDYCDKFIHANQLGKPLNRSDAEGRYKDYESDSHEIRSVVTDEMFSYVDYLVEKGLFKSKSEFIRHAIRQDMFDRREK